MKRIVILMNIVIALVFALYVVASVSMIIQSDNQTEIEPDMQLGSVLARGLTLTMGMPLLFSVLSMMSLTYTVKRHPMPRLSVTVVRILLMIGSLSVAATSIGISLNYIGIIICIPNLIYRVHYGSIPVFTILWVVYYNLLREKRG